MAKQSKKIQDVKDIEVKPEIVKPTKKLPVKDYVVKNYIKTDKKEYFKGDKISLTIEGYRFFRAQNKV